MTNKNNKIVHTYSTINPLLNVLFLFQYGLLIPFLLRFESMTPIVIFTVFLTLICVLANGIKIIKHVFWLICIPLLLILLKTVVTPVLIGEDNTNDILLGFLSIGVSGILIGSASYNFNRFLYYGTIVGWMNFAILFLIPVLRMDGMSYMRFGYAMLPTFFFSVYSLFRKEHKIINGLIVLISGIEIILFGARGSFMAICIFLGIVFFLCLKRRENLLFQTVLLTILIILILFYDSILVEADRLLRSFGYSSYSVMKFLKLVEGTGDIESTSSGRFRIYQVALKQVAENPVFGSPLNSSLITAGISYYHNVFFDVVVNFGIVLFLCFFLLISKSYIEATKADDMQLRWIYCILFVLSFGRLIVSSVFWQRPEFWLFLSFYITKRKSFLKRK